MNPTIPEVLFLSSGSKLSIAICSLAVSAADTYYLAHHTNSDEEVLDPKLP